MSGVSYCDTRFYLANETEFDTLTGVGTGNQFTNCTFIINAQSPGDYIQVYLNSGQFKGCQKTYNQTNESVQTGKQRVFNGIANNPDGTVVDQNTVYPTYYFSPTGLSDKFNLVIHTGAQHYSNGVLMTDFSVNYNFSQLTRGLNYFYFLDGGNMTGGDNTTQVIEQSTTKWNYLNSTPLYAVYWNGTQTLVYNELYPGGQYGMSENTRRYLCETQGTQIVNGLAITHSLASLNYSFADTTGTAQYIQTADLKIRIQQGTVITSANIQNMWYTGAVGSTGQWNWGASSGSGYKVSSNSVQYSKNTDGTYALDAATNGYFVNYWIVVLNTVYPVDQIYSIVGQQQYQTSAQAVQATLESEFGATLSGVFTQAIFLYRLTYQSSSSGAPTMFQVYQLNRNIQSLKFEATGNFAQINEGGTGATNGQLALKNLLSDATTDVFAAGDVNSIPIVNSSKQLVLQDQSTIRANLYTAGSNISITNGAIAVSGQIPIANGGTGQSNGQSALKALFDSSDTISHGKNQYAMPVLTGTGNSQNLQLVSGQTLVNDVFKNQTGQGNVRWDGTNVTAEKVQVSCELFFTVFAIYNTNVDITANKPFGQDVSNFGFVYLMGQNQQNQNGVYMYDRSNLQALLTATVNASYYSKAMLMHLTTYKVYANSNTVSDYQTNITFAETNPDSILLKCAAQNNDIITIFNGESTGVRPYIVDEYQTKNMEMAYLTTVNQQNQNLYIIFCETTQPITQYDNPSAIWRYLPLFNDFKIANTNITKLQIQVLNGSRYGGMQYINVNQSTDIIGVNSDSYNHLKFQILESTELSNPYANMSSLNSQTGIPDQLQFVCRLQHDQNVSNLNSFTAGVVDGLGIRSNDFIYLSGQTTPKQNGVYKYNDPTLYPIWTTDDTNGGLISLNNLSTKLITKANMSYSHVKKSTIFIMDGDKYGLMKYVNVNQPSDTVAGYTTGLKYSSTSQLQTSVSTNTSNISTLQTTATGLQTQITNLPTKSQKIGNIYYCAAMSLSNINTVTAPSTIDDITLQVGDYVYLSGQTVVADRGIYKLLAIGGNLSAVVVQSTMSELLKLQQIQIVVLGGTTYIGKQFYNGNVLPYTQNSTALIWYEYGPQQQTLYNLLSGNDSVAGWTVSDRYKTPMIVNTTGSNYGVQLQTPSNTLKYLLNTPSVSGLMYWDNSTFTSSVVTSVAIANGGTGQTTQQTAINALVGTVGTAGKVLRSDGTNVSMSSLVSSDLPTVAIAQGGTGQTTQAAALTALAGTQTNKYIMASDGTDTALRSPQVVIDNIAMSTTSGLTSIAQGSILAGDSSNHMQLITQATATTTLTGVSDKTYIQGAVSNGFVNANLTNYQLVLAFHDNNMYVYQALTEAGTVQYIFQGQTITPITNSGGEVLLASVGGVNYSQQLALGSANNTITKYFDQYNYATVNLISYYASYIDATTGYYYYIQNNEMFIGGMSGMPQNERASIIKQQGMTLISGCELTSITQFNKEYSIGSSPGSVIVQNGIVGLADLTINTATSNTVGSQMVGCWLSDSPISWNFFVQYNLVSGQAYQYENQYYTSGDGFYLAYGKYPYLQWSHDNIFTYKTTPQQKLDSAGYVNYWIFVTNSAKQVCGYNSTTLTNTGQLFTIQGMTKYSTFSEALNAQIFDSTEYTYLQITNLFQQGILLYKIVYRYKATGVHYEIAGAQEIKQSIQQLYKLLNNQKYVVQNGGIGALNSMLNDQSSTGLLNWNPTTKQTSVSTLGTGLQVDTGVLKFNSATGQTGLHTLMQGTEANSGWVIGDVGKIAMITATTSGYGLTTQAQTQLLGTSSLTQNKIAYWNGTTFASITTLSGGLSFDSGASTLTYTPSAGITNAGTAFGSNAYIGIASGGTGQITGQEGLYALLTNGDNMSLITDDTKNGYVPIITKSDTKHTLTLGKLASTQITLSTGLTNAESAFATSAQQALVNMNGQPCFNGVEDSTKFTCEISGASNNTITIKEAIGAKYYFDGQSKTYATANTETSATLSVGLTYVYFTNATGTLYIGSSIWDIMTAVPLFSIYYGGASSGNQAIVFDERHAGGLKGMSKAVHKNLHLTRGTQLIDGCGFTQNSNTYTIETGRISDEDLITSTAQATTDSIRVLYYQGTLASGYWTTVAPSATGTNYMGTAGTQIQCIQNSGGTYSLVNTGPTSYVNYWVVASQVHAPDVGTKFTDQILVLPGKTQTSQSNAVNSTISAEYPTALLQTIFNEAVFLYQVTYRQNGGSVSLVQYKQITQSIISVVSSQLAITPIQYGGTGQTTGQAALNALMADTVTTGTFTPSNIIQANSNGQMVPVDVHSVLDANFNMYICKAQQTSNVDVSSASPASTVDSVALVAGDYVYLSGQSTTTQNGVYLYNGSTTVMTAILTSATSMTISKLQKIRIQITAGSTYINKTYYNTNTAFTQNSTALTFAILSENQILQANTNGNLMPKSTSDVLTTLLGTSPISGALSWNGSVVSGVAIPTLISLLGSSPITGALSWNGSAISGVTIPTLDSLFTGYSTGMLTYNGSHVTSTGWTLSGSNGVGFSGGVIGLLSNPIGKQDGLIALFTNQAASNWGNVASSKYSIPMLYGDPSSGDTQNLTMTTRQTAINQLVGGQGTAGKVLRSDGTNVSMSSLVSTDLPTVGIAQGGTGVSNKTTLQGLVGSMFSDTNDSGLTKGNVIYVDKTNGNVKADTFTNIGLYGNGATTFQNSPTSMTSADHVASNVCACWAVPVGGVPNASNVANTSNYLFWVNTTAAGVPQLLLSAGTYYIKYSIQTWIQGYATGLLTELISSAAEIQTTDNANNFLIKSGQTITEYPASICLQGLNGLNGTITPAIVGSFTGNVIATITADTYFTVINHTTITGQTGYYTGNTDYTSISFEYIKLK